MAKLITPDGTITPVSPANGKKFTLVELQQYVGGYIQIIDGQQRKIGGSALSDVQKDFTFDVKKNGSFRVRMVINEEGKLQAFAPNRIATFLVRGILMPGDFIVGNALVMEKGDSM